MVAHSHSNRSWIATRHEDIDRQTNLTGGPVIDSGPTRQCMLVSGPHISLSYALVPLVANPAPPMAQQLSDVECDR